MEHLKGLRRLSPCCESRVAHPVALKIVESDGKPIDPLYLICLMCKCEVKEHVLVNAQGFKVWPVDVSNLPILPKRKRVRRRREPEAEPEGYPVHLPGGLKLLRRMK